MGKGYNPYYSVDDNDDNDKYIVSLEDKGPYGRNLTGYILPGMDINNNGIPDYTEGGAISYASDPIPVRTEYIRGDRNNNGLIDELENDWK